MKLLTVCLLLVLAVLALAAPQKKEPSSVSPPSGSPFIASFDEIVVESNLRVKGKTPGDRSGRAKLVVSPPATSLDKNKA